MFKNKNKSMRSLLAVFAFFIIFSLVFYFAPDVLADSNIESGVSDVGDATGLAKTDVRVIIGNIIRVILGFVGVVALGLVIYGGWLYMTSGGAEDKVAKAKKYLINATIGLVIIFSAYAITTFIIRSLTDAVAGAGTYQCSDGKDNDGDGFVDFPNDDGCATASDYSEYGGGDLNIVGGGQLRAKSITPQGDQAILNVHPRIVLNRSVQENSVNSTNVTISSAGGSTQTTDVRPVEVTESLGNGDQILSQILEDDDVINPNWVVCSATYLGETPMTVKYDISNLTSPSNAALSFESSYSGENATMDLYCGNTDNPTTEVKDTWLPPNGDNTVSLPDSCLQGDEVYIKWVRRGSNCLKFDYMWLTVDHEVDSNVDGSFVLKNSGRVIEFVPSGECTQENPEAYGLSANTEYTITLKTGGLQSVEGYSLSCGAGSVCVATFTTGSTCDTEDPNIAFNNLSNKQKICQLTEDNPDYPNYPVSIEGTDDSGVSLIALSVDGEEVGSEGPTASPTPKTYSTFIDWAVNDYELGSHQVSATVNDLDGNSKTKNITVYLKPDFCCDESGTVVCGDPACGACDGDQCVDDADCAHGECVEGQCVSFPVINNMNPKEGSAGNVVTIVGSGFGDYDEVASKVYFSTGNAGGEYSLEAEVPAECGSATWSNSQIIVRVPANTGTGPIKVVNKSGKEDDTENEFGWQGEYTYNPNIKYPGLLSVDPNSGVPTSYTDLCGVDFGSLNSGDKVYFGENSGTLTGSWSDTSITQVRVPQINKGIYRMSVGKYTCQRLIDGCDSSTTYCYESCAADDAGCECADVFSNAVNFKVTEATTLPTITNIDPKVCEDSDGASCNEGEDNCSCVESAPAEQLITLNGTGFGSAIGQVIFIPLQGNETDGFAPLQDADGNEEPSFIGVPACGAGSWTDTQIIIKVPSTKTVDGETYDITSGNYWVKVITSQSLPSNDRLFIVNDNTPGPGLCSISPNNGPVGVLFDINGENFGDDNEYSYEVSFVKNGTSRTATAAPGNWSNSLIEEAAVPADALSGGVRIQSSDSSIKSNEIHFNVGACNDTSCGDDEFCCYDGVCRAATAPEDTKDSVCGGSIVSYESEFAWVVSTGIIPKIPQVVERTCMITTGVDYPQSPSPAKDTKKACPNSMISATFNMLIDESTLTDNVVIKRCLTTGQEESCDLDTCAAGDCSELVLSSLSNTDVTGAVNTPAEPGVPASISCETAEGDKCQDGEDGCVCSASIDSFTSFTLYNTLVNLGAAADVVVRSSDNYKMYEDTWYQVEIKGGETGITAPALPGSSSGKPMKSNYVWKFKTKEGDCQPSSFMMKPARGKISAIDDLQTYWVTGVFECQEISMAGESWSWSVNPGTDADKVQAHGYACAVEDSAPFCDLANGQSDHGVYGVKDSAVNCGSCDRYNDDCDCVVTTNVETSEDDLVQVMAQAVIGGNSYSEGADLAVDFGDPQVIYYYPDCNEACINAQLYARFNVRMKENVVESSDNIKIYSCFSQDCLVLSDAGLTVTPEYLYNASVPQNRLNLDFTSNLQPNKYYRVVFSGAMESYSGVPLAELNYRDTSLPGDGLNSFSWIFKTKNDANECRIDTVGVSPADYVASEPGEVVDYMVSPRSAPDSCDPNGQALNPLNYDWNWSTDPDDGDPNSGAPLAFLTSNTYSTANFNICTDKCVLKGSLVYRSVCGDGIIESGEECEFDGATILDSNGDPTTEISCDAQTCLVESFANCGFGETANCCGNGVLDGEEECDQGCVYEDASGDSCSPVEEGCVCVAQGSACTAGCLNSGTDAGFECGNGIVEPGEDVDDGNKASGDGVSAFCLNEGSETAINQISSRCGDLNIDPGEECDGGDNCTTNCLWKGFDSCGDGVLDADAGEECEKNNCVMLTSCEGMEVEASYCDVDTGLPNCSINESGDCECFEIGSSVCQDGFMQTVCNPADDGEDCICDFPDWCNTNCTNKGSNSNYGSICGNGQLENGEDSDCEAGITTDGSLPGSPYQTATINDEKHTANNSVYAVLTLLTKDAGKSTYSDTTQIQVATVENVGGVDEDRESETDLTLRVPESVYDAAIEATCNPTPWTGTFTPAPSSVDNCRNVAPTFVTTQDIDDSNAEIVWYYSSAVECPAEYPELASAASTPSEDSWFDRAVDKVKVFVHKLLFKVGIAAPPYSCSIPFNLDVQNTDAGYSVTLFPKVVLPANQNLIIQLKDYKNSCGSEMTANPLVYPFTTGDDICRINKVSVSPAEVFVMKGGVETNYTAYARYNDVNLVQVPGVYTWDWSWTSSDSALAGVASEDEENAVISTYTKNGSGTIKATATETFDALNDGGALKSFSGYGNITVFVCDNPWFGDVSDFGGSYESVIPAAFAYNPDDGEVHQKFDITYATTSDGSLQPSYLVEKEHNVGLFYCRDYGEPGNLDDDLPLIGLGLGDFTELDPEPRFGVYFDRNFDYVKSTEDFNFMSSAFTFSAWVYNDDLPVDRYVRLFYKNLDDTGSGAQDHVEVALRSWANNCNAGCSWQDVLLGTKTRGECGCDDPKRSVVFRIKNNGQTIYKAVEDSADLMSDGFNLINLTYDAASGDADLYINNDNVTADMSDETSGGLPMYVWPRNIDEESAAGADFKKAFIGGLGKTGVPLTSLGGYVDEVRLWQGIKTNQEIMNYNTDGLVGYWNFDTNTNNTVGVNSVAHCTADYVSGDAASQCLAGSDDFAHINITNVAKEEGILYSQGNSWLDVSPDIENQCNDGVDNDNNGLTDLQDPKCLDDYDGWESPALFAQYFFVRKQDDNFEGSNDYAPDGISLRIYENPEYLRPQEWYNRYAPNPASSVPEVNADCLTDQYGEFCYQGIRDGRSVYVGAANIYGDNAFNNIYLLSYSQGSNTATQNIFSQLTQFLRFNMNIVDGTSAYQKIEVIRDNQRTTDMVLIRQYLDVYRSQNNQVPQLQSGTLQRNYSYSNWDSWNSELGVIGEMPEDPINSLAVAPPAIKCNRGGVACNKCVNAEGQICSQDDPTQTTCVCDDLCVCDIQRTMDCGFSETGYQMACLSNEQCSISGVACVLCSDAYDVTACYKGSDQSLSDIYTYNSTSVIPAEHSGAQINYVYSYQSNSADTNQYKLEMNYETQAGSTPLNFRYVPEYATSATGWDELVVDEAETLAEVPEEGTLPECMDNIDNDGNGLIDYPNDPGCDSADDTNEDFSYACSDGADNDGDGLIDMADPSCSGLFDDDELRPAECNDGVDNDNNGSIDFPDDMGCVEANDNDETIRGLPSGPILYAFLADNSASMNGNDPGHQHLDLIEGIVSGVDTDDGHINGIDDIKGNDAYYILYTSRSITKEYGASNGAQAFLDWLNTPGYPYAYVGHAGLPVKINGFVNAALAHYNGENLDGDEVNYNGIVFIVMTDAGDNALTSSNQAAMASTVATVEGIPSSLHLIYIGSSGNPDDYKYYQENQTDKLKGIFVSGNINELPTLLEQFISDIAQVSDVIDDTGDDQSF